MGIIYISNLRSSIVIIIGIVSTEDHVWGSIAGRLGDWGSLPAVTPVVLLARRIEREAP